MYYWNLYFIITYQLPGLLENKYPIRVTYEDLNDLL